MATVDTWNPERCNLELHGEGLFSIARWDKVQLNRFPIDADLEQRFAKELKEWPRPTLMLTHKGPLSDSLMCSTVAFELKKRKVPQVWLETKWPEAFEGQPLFDRVLPENYESEWLVTKLGGKIIYPQHAIDFAGQDRSIAPPSHLLAEMCRNAGILGKVALRPYYTVPKETTLPKLPEKYVVIQGIGSPGSRYPVLTRDWYQDRYQTVVDALLNHVPVVQVGSGFEPPLRNTLDLRGQTTVQQTAAILDGAHFYIGQVGALMHLARAVDCPAIIIYGGRELPDQSGYEENVNWAGDVKCKPCWIRQQCPYGMACMNDIMPNVVIDSAMDMLGKKRQKPLPVHKAEVGLLPTLK